MSLKKLGFKLTWVVALTFVGVNALLVSATWAADTPATVYVMQADDRLEKLAEKYYSDPLAYPTIIQATNAQAAIDDRFTTIESPARVIVGQRLVIPNRTPGSTEITRSASGPTAEQQKLLATLERKGVPPELDNEIWLNSEPLKLADLRGKVVIVEFWTYG
jgi:hypothetical protein